MILSADVDLLGRLRAAFTITRTILLSSLFRRNACPVRNRERPERGIVGSSKPEVPMTLVCLCFPPWAVPATPYSTNLPVYLIWLIIWDLRYPFPALFKTITRIKEASGEA